jgi:hypothetical protein
VRVEENRQHAGQAAAIADLMQEGCLTDPALTIQDDDLVARVAEALRDPTQVFVATVEHVRGANRIADDIWIRYRLEFSLLPHRDQQPIQRGPELRDFIMARRRIEHLKAAFGRFVDQVGKFVDR